MKRNLVRNAAWLVLLLTAAAAGCAYRGPATNIVDQRATWISYISGDDVRARCLAGESDRYRLVFNADRTRHARGYDIWDVREGAVMDQMVDRGIVFDFGENLDVTQLGMPGRARAVLSESDFAEFESLLEASGVFDPPPEGLRLASIGFYWIISGCKDGRFFLTAYYFPSDKYQQIRFDSFLQSWDRTGIRYPVPPTPERALRAAHQCPRGNSSQGRKARCFVIQIGNDGIVGW